MSWNHCTRFHLLNKKNHRHHIKTQKDFLLSLVNQSLGLNPQCWGEEGHVLDTRGEEVNWSLDQLVSVPTLTCDLGKVKVTDRNSRKEFVL